MLFELWIFLLKNNQKKKRVKLIFNSNGVMNIEKYITNLKCVFHINENNNKSILLQFYSSHKSRH